MLEAGSSSPHTKQKSAAKLIISAAGIGWNRTLQFVTCHILQHLITLSQGGEMNASKPRALLFSNIFIAESISMFLFKGDFRSVATTLSGVLPVPSRYSLCDPWALESQCNQKARKRGPLRSRKQRFLLQNGLFTCFPFSMSRLAFQQLRSESQVQTTFEIQTNL